MTTWEPSSADYYSILTAQNPWKDLGTVPLELAPTTYRPLADVLWRVVADKQARRHQIILGPRRVGKTTVMYQTVQQLLSHGVPVERLWWLRLDHPLLLNWSLGKVVAEIVNLTKATHHSPAYLFLDELTYAADWDLWLKTFHDERYPVRIVGTSSATAAIRQRGTESGVGRWDEQYLSPYLFTEYLSLKGRPAGCPVERTLGRTLTAMISRSAPVPNLADARQAYLLTGGFPELLVDAKPDRDEASAILKSQRVLRSDAIEKAIYKDIPQAFAIRDPAKLERLLYVLAGQIAQLLSPNNIATTIGMAAKTIESYINYLERAFLVFTLNNYSNSEESVQRRGKRVYFIDGAVRNAALLRGVSPMNDPIEMGHLVENLVAGHLRSLAYQESVRLYHWREKELEVDLVYDHPEDPLAFEITLSKSHTRKGCHELQERFKAYRGKCFLVAPDAPYHPPEGIRPGTLPLDALLVAIGSQEQFALESRIHHPASTADGQLLLF
jgi:uncharacterized protein